MNIVLDAFKVADLYFIFVCSQQAEGSDSKAAAELLDMIFEKVSYTFFTICRVHF